MIEVTDTTIPSLSVNAISGWSLSDEEEEEGWCVLEDEDKKSRMIQCWFRCVVARKECRKRINRNKRGKKRRNRKLKAATKIQAMARGFLVRPKFQAMLQEKRDKDDLLQSVKDLEDRLRESETLMVERVKEARSTALREAKAFYYGKKYKKKSAKMYPQSRCVSDETHKVIGYYRRGDTKLRIQVDHVMRNQLQTEHLEEDPMAAQEQ